MTSKCLEPVLTTTELGKQKLTLSNITILFSDLDVPCDAIIIGVQDLLNDDSHYKTPSSILKCFTNQKVLVQKRNDY